MLVALAAALLSGCGAAGAGSAPDGSGRTSDGVVTVFAAASLAEAFGDIGRGFQQDHPGTTVTFNFGASSALAQQIVSGAPADVFAAAAPAAMTTVTGTGRGPAPRVFARNRLEIVVPPGNPGDVTGLSDFARRELTIALCEAQVPCGTASRAALAAAGVTPLPDTLEQDVKAVLSKVRLGEVDAGLVYRTDVRAASSSVRGIGFAEADRAVNDYPIATLAGSRAPAAAAAFVDYVLSGEGRKALAAAGFDAP